MMNQEELKRLSTRFQTSRINVAREYLQHYFLFELYKLKISDKLLFKGGTALRFIYQSPRFSEDLDFTGIKNITHYEIEDLLNETLAHLSTWGFKLDIKEAKQTTGGYLSKIEFTFLDFKIEMKIEISFRTKGEKIEKEISRIKNEYISHYDVYHLSQKEIIDGKLTALLSRAKSRDWYDLYFFIHNNMLEAGHKKLLPKILEKLKKSKTDFKAELKNFLPRSYHFILKDFRKNLEKELKRFC